MNSELRYPNSEFISEEIITEIKEDVDETNSRQSNNFREIEILEDLPFERTTIRAFYDFYKAHNPETDLSKSDIYEDMEKRREMFEDLTRIEQEKILKAIVQFANDNEGEVLLAMRLTGRETDSLLANDLEMKYGIDADKVRIAQEIFKISYTFSDIDHEVSETFYGDELSNSRYNRILAYLIDIDESANYLEQFELPATHVTSQFSGDKIKESNVIRMSSTIEKPAHYLGDGVYAGILGCYKNWNEYAEPDMFEFRIPLAETVPIITHYTFEPRAQIDILGEGLDIQDTKSMVATAEGLQQWHNIDDGFHYLPGWKLRMIEDILKVPVEVVVDKNGVETIIADTDKEPIHWGLLARALRIPRFIPKNQLSKSDIAYTPPDELLS